jgi:hypothetical protein
MSWSNHQSVLIFALKIKEINSALPEAKLNPDCCLLGSCHGSLKSLPQRILSLTKKWMQHRKVGLAKLVGLFLFFSLEK